MLLKILEFFPPTLGAFRLRAITKATKLKQRNAKLAVLTAATLPTVMNAKPLNISLIQANSANSVNLDV